MEFFERTVYSPEHEQFRSAFRAWLDKEVAPNHDQWERDGITPRDIWLQAVSVGEILAVGPILEALHRRV